jgi:hypothetical protein
VYHQPAGAVLQTARDQEAEEDQCDIANCHQAPRTGCGSPSSRVLRFPAEIIRDPWPISLGILAGFYRNSLKFHGQIYSWV